MNLLLFFKNNRKHFPIEFLLLGFFLVLTFLPLWVTASRLSYIAYNNSSDTFLYLDIAKNIATGQGFVVSFNNYQYWPGIFYPALPFIHIGLPLVLSVFYRVFSSIEAYIFFNAVLAFLNCFLIYGITRRLYQNKVLAVWTTVFIASTICLQNTVLRILTEQLSLLVTLPAILLFVSPREPSRRRLMAIGFLLGLGVFIRSSNVVYLLAFVLALLLRPADQARRWKEAFFLCLWPLAMFVVYEWAVYGRYHVFFPEYPKAFKNFYVATFLTGGQFFKTSPVIRPYGYCVFVDKAMVNVVDTGRVLFAVLRLLLFFAVWRFVQIFRERPRGELVLFWLAILQITSIIVFYPYAQLHEFELVRFLLLPVIALAILGIKEFADFARRFFPKTKIFLFHSVLFIVFMTNYYQSYRIMASYGEKEHLQVVKGLKTLAGWVTNNTKASDLVAASEFIYGSFYLDRPTVAMPFCNTLNKKNLEDFLKIYNPKVIIFEKSFVLERFVEPLGYKKVREWLPDSNFDIFQR